MSCQQSNNATHSSCRRWFIAGAGTCLQLFLGTVYAWSYFQKPLVSGYSWSNTQVAGVFSLAIATLGLAAAWGGLRLPRFGPRRLAMLGGFLFGSGYLLGAMALKLHSLPLLYFGYGLIGGAGLGLGYVTPVATVAKWFPDKKGFATGMVIMGFGLGALAMSKIFAPLLMEWSKSPEHPQGNLVAAFTVLGVVFMVATMLMGYFLINPPAATASGTVRNANSLPAALPGSAGDAKQPHAAECLRTRTFWLMWLIFFANIVAGIAIISFQSPILQGLLQAGNPDLTPARLASLGATLIACSSLFNGVGRFFWGGLSDRIGRLSAFRLMLGTQAVVFLLLVLNRNPWVFGIAVCYILLCYGGGFGTMPSYMLDVFGARLMPVAYGCVLTAWSAAGVAGPQLIALLTDRFPERASTYAFAGGSMFLLGGLLVSMFIQKSTREATLATSDSEAKNPDGKAGREDGARGGS